MYISMLIELGSLNMYSLAPDNGDNFLVPKRENRTMPIPRMHSHLCLELDKSEVHYKARELQKKGFTNLSFQQG